jgi:hypothetical protein
MSRPVGGIDSSRAVVSPPLTLPAHQIIATGSDGCFSCDIRFAPCLRRSRVDGPLSEGFLQSWPSAAHPRRSGNLAGWARNGPTQYTARPRLFGCFLQVSVHPILSSDLESWGLFLPLQNAQPRWSNDGIIRGALVIAFAAFLSPRYVICHRPWAAAMPRSERRIPSDVAFLLHLRPCFRSPAPPLPTWKAL